MLSSQTHEGLKISSKSWKCVIIQTSLSFSHFLPFQSLSPSLLISINFLVPPFLSFSLSLCPSFNLSLLHFSRWPTTYSLCSIHTLWEDSVEFFFGKQRAAGGRSDNPTVKEFCSNTVSLRVQGSSALKPVCGNCGKKLDQSQRNHSKETEIHNRRVIIMHAQ